MLNIEFWSDYACPFCYIGKRLLEKALEQYNKEVEIVYKSFQLHPEAKRLQGVSYSTIISKKYGIPVEEAQYSIEQVTLMAKSLGLDYNLDKLIHNNTLNAHRLSKYAKTQGKAEDMEERLLKAYFIDFLDIGDIDTLAVLSQEIGLNGDYVKDMLKTDDFKYDVLNDQKEAFSKRIHVVPHIIIGEEKISGAQPSEIFLKALQKA